MGQRPSYRNVCLLNMCATSSKYLHKHPKKSHPPYPPLIHSSGPQIILTSPSSLDTAWCPYKIKSMTFEKSLFESGSFGRQINRSTGSRRDMTD